MGAMLKFNEDKQKQKVRQLREREEEELVRILADKYGVEYADLTSVAIDTDALRILPETDSRAAQVALFAASQKKVSLAARLPESKETKSVIVSLEERGFIPTIFIVSTRSLAFAWDRYKDIVAASGTSHGLLDIGNDEIEMLVSRIRTIDDAVRSIEEVLKLKKTSRVSRVVEVFLAAALAVGASDVHIEPEEKSVRLRFRLDGILMDVVSFDNETFRLLLSRIKLLSGLKLNIHEEPQDGRFSIRMRDKDIEIRTSTLPDENGESVVMRLLDPSSIRVSIEDLGIHPQLLKVIERELQKPNGMILTTGPTGSGKTTTLYAFLRRVHKPEIKIITIEDPIEYHLPGIVQTQTDEGKDYTFASGLRAALRQDPDIMMVGEIRDRETAEIAMNAALTGHLVFSTLHTNNAAGAFPRLIDLGVNSNLMGSAINLVLAQRLVRRLAPEYSKKVPIPENKKQLVADMLARLPDTIQKPQTEYMWDVDTELAGHETGYRGRVGVYEGILVDDAVDNAVRTGGSDRDIIAAAAPQKILSMRDDGILKVLSGITTFDELARVVNVS